MEHVLYSLVCTISNIFTIYYESTNPMDLSPPQQLVLYTMNSVMRICANDVDYWQLLLLLLQQCTLMCIWLSHRRRRRHHRRARRRRRNM